MTRLLARILLAAILAMGMAAWMSSGALAVEEVEYHREAYFTGLELREARDRFRRAHEMEQGIPIPIGQADIDMDGRPEIFLTDTRPAYCGTAGCSTSIYKNVDGEWIGVGALQSIFGTGFDPLIYIREEVVDGLRTYYSSYHDPVTNPGPDQRVIFGTADEILTDEEWRSLPLQYVTRSGEFRFGRFDMDDDGIDEVFTSRIPEGDCDNWNCWTNIYVKYDNEWFSPDAFGARLHTLFGDDGLPHIYVRDEWKDGYRTYYSNLGGPRGRVPFSSWELAPFAPRLDAPPDHLPFE